MAGLVLSFGGVLSGVVDAVSLGLGAGTGILGAIGTVVTFPRTAGLYRVRTEVSGHVIRDKKHIEEMFDKITSISSMPKMVSHIKTKIKTEKDLRKADIDFIVSPSEVDHIPAYILANMLNKRFCTVNASPMWDKDEHLKDLNKFRYNSVEKDKNCIVFLPVLTSGDFLERVLSLIYKEGAKVKAVVCIVDASRGQIDELFRRRNITLLSVEAAPRN